MLQFLIAHPKFAETDFSRLKGIITAAAPCSKAVMKVFLDKGVPISQTYGMTEAGPSNCGYVARSDSMDELLDNSASIGTSMFHCDSKIINQESGAEVEHGEIGVLCLRSSHNFDGYLNDPARTGKVIQEDGWIYTGDLAQQDPDGLLYIRGRADNMFISGGENISPEEIENALMKHPAVAGALCAGIPDPKWGQAPVALVVFHAGTQSFLPGSSGRLQGSETNPAGYRTAAHRRWQAEPQCRRRSLLVRWALSPCLPVYQHTCLLLAAWPQSIM